MRDLTTDCTISADVAQSLELEFFDSRSAAINWMCEV